MKEFEGRVAVIFGAGNGFGLEFAKECATRRMKIVLVDIDKNDVERTLDFVKKMGADAISVAIDASVESEVASMVDNVMETYGQIDLLFNNAGVAITGPVWEVPIRDWEWIMGVNVMSQIYAMKLIIPIMLKQGTPCHIVNTASIAGLLTTTGMPLYHTTKFASVALTEAVAHDLKAINANIKMSVYCPGFVQTDLYNYERHRPERFKDDTDPYYSSELYKAGLARAKYSVTTGIPVDSVALSVFTAIEEEQFYILTHPKYNAIIGGRVKAMLEGSFLDMSSR